jgi:glycosyltransferase involved in cell wall biosynthesis
MVSRLLRDKGIYEFIDAAEILKNENVEFWVLGDSDAANSSALPKEEVTKLSNLGIVSFFDRTDDVKTFLGKVDCVVLPSYREGSPRSIMEASSSELPVIVSNVPGCRNVVDNNITGLYCKVKDSYDLAQKMKIMLRMSKSDREKMGERGRNKMLNNFDEAIVLDKYNNVIVDLLKNNSEKLI